MEKYIKPSIVECGKSEGVIKGRSGRGTENFWFRKVGSRMTGKWKRVQVQSDFYKIK
ncbi:hypothetical protein [Bacillus cereus]|nr:hypothetical protein [Bacillus cereus]